MDNKYEQLIEEIQDQCEYFSRDIITRPCKRAIRKMNSWNVQIGSGDYPASFSFFDILSIEHQSKGYAEIALFLQDAIEDALDSEYEKLSSQERFFVDYSRCYYDNGCNPSSVQNQIYSRFNDMLNEHWITKKISNFEMSKSW